MRDHGVELGPGDAMLDWGSSTGRVLRWFAEEARTVEVWGATARILHHFIELLYPILEKNGNRSFSIEY